VNKIKKKITLLNLFHFLSLFFFFFYFDRYIKNIYILIGDNSKLLLLIITII